jgi:Sigma-70 region 2
MQDRAVVAAVVAGDADGFGAAYDQYAASLYAYCHSVLPEPEAAEAVLDTFLIAAAKLDGLGDPDRLGAWLQAVARNECLRRLGPAGLEGAGAARPGKPRSADLDDELPAVTLPAGLRGKVLAACMDRTPTGRAYRMSAAHRAGAFGPAGFPRAIGPSGPRWWRRARRHPGLVSAIAMLAALVVTAVIIVIVTAGGGSHRPQAAGAGLAAQVPAPASSAAPGSTGQGRTSPSPSARKATAPAAPVLAGASGPASPSGRPTPPASSSPSPTPSSSSSPAQGYLQVAPDEVMLTSKAGKPASGSFALTAANGPVSQYTVRVAAKAGKVSVTPMAGSLPVNGFVQVTVTVTSKVALTTQIVVEPGNISVTVFYKPKPVPVPAPSPGNG